MAFWSGLRTAAWVTVLVAASSAAQVHAFCRESVMSQSSGPCVETEGVPLLHWTRSCLTYVFNDQLFSRLPLLKENEIRSTFNQSYESWADVDCGDERSPFFVEQANGVTQTSKAEFVYDERNEAIVVARTRSEWAALPNHDPTALAFTLLWHDKNSGEILDVDMELNTGAGRFADCNRGCSSNMVDLANTITHEAGHLLGLGHSSVRGATMTTTAIGAETEKRTLEADDKAGYCALDLPEFECAGSKCECEPPPIYPSQKTVESCGCRTLGDAQPGAQHTALFASSALLGL
ncbi:MAG TPA: matrixin family metalloprotease, partial [Polyangiales bacterium]|nr:matrixin family metalloprotease [Polyangiales bacterium]